MSDFDILRDCVCVLWFGGNGTSDSGNGELRPNSSSKSSFDHLCSSLWSTGSTFSPSSANVIEEWLYARVAVSICCFGILGNAVNLVVLSAQSFQTSSGRMQQFARIGLMSLAVSDSLFCLSILPHAFVERDPASTSVTFSLVFSAYGEAAINTFAMVGTWLTVAMSTGRYAAVCHPFRARAAIGRTVALRVIVAVGFSCAVFNIPRFFRNTIESCPLRSADSDGQREMLYFRSEHRC